MRIAVLLKEVPDTYSDREMNLETGLTDRSGDVVADEVSERAVEAALRAAEAGDMQPFTELLHAVTHPWEPHPSYEQPDPNGLAGFLTYCGT